MTDFSRPVELSFEGVTITGGLGAGTGIAFFNEGSGNWVSLSSFALTGTGGKGFSKHLTKFTLLSVSSSAGGSFSPPGGPGGGGGGGGGSSSTTPPPQLTFDNSAGGIIGNGDVTILFPPGAVSDPGRVEASITAVNMLSLLTASAEGRSRVLADIIPTPEGSAFGSGAFRFNVTVGGQPATLQQPVTISSKYTADDVAAAGGGGSATGLRLMHYDPTARTWSDLGAKAANGVLTGASRNTGLFAVAVTLATPKLNLLPEGVPVGLGPLLT